MNLKNCIAVVLLVVTGFTTTLGFAQDANEKKFIKRVSKEACGCLDEINANLGKEEVLERINSCVTTAIIKQQTDADSSAMKEMKMLIDEALKAEEGTTVGDGKTFTVYADKNFKEIQQYMMETCPRMKTLVASNDMLSDKSLSGNPEAMKYYNKGIDYFQKQKFDKAAQSYSKAVELDPKFAFAWDNLGLTYRNLGNYDEALRCYRKSLEVDPYGILPLQNIATVYMYKKEYNEAAAAYDKLVEANNEDPEGYYGAGRAYFLAGNYAKGCDYIFQAYLLYNELRSPYLKDAQDTLSWFYSDLKEKGQLQVILDAAKKYKIDLK